MPTSTRPSAEHTKALRRCLVALAALVLTVARSLAAPAPVLSVEDAYKPPGVLQARLSPDGQHLAAIVYNGVNQSVLLVKTADMSRRLIVQGQWARDGGYLVNRNVRSLVWVTPTTLAVNYVYGAEAVDLSGKRVADLRSGALGKTVPSNPQSGLVLVFDDDDFNSLAVVDTATGKRRVLRYPMRGKPQSWAFDDAGELRALTLLNAIGDGRSTVAQWYRPINSKNSGQNDRQNDRQNTSPEWKLLDERPVTQVPPFTPLAARADKDELVVAAHHQRDTAALFRYDPLTRTFGELLAGHPKEDIAGIDEPLANTFDSVVTLGMKPIRHWFDSRWAGLQKAVDEALPGRVNTLSGDNAGLVLVHSHGDVDPGRWLLLDSRDMRLQRIFVARPGIDPDAMRPVSVISYPAPDGLAIPAYLAQPAGAGPHPMVVMVHGGPAVRDHWQWQPDVQLLATRGYAVFQPQFRGSAGFGLAFQEAGHGQWGRAMQDDITAGVEHLVRTGVADPKRICIYGASYGGYAAVWGLIKTPQLYQCGVTFAGVSDINHLLSDWFTDADAVSREVRRVQIGDPKVDKARFDAVSPLLRAQDIRVPLLIAHGQDDVRVKVAHSRRLMRAMDRQKRPYEWLPLADEGHGLRWVSSEVTFAQRLIDFLDRHIGPGTASALGAAPAPAAAPDNRAP